MKTRNLFLCLGVVSREAWICLCGALRSRVLPALIAVLNLIPAGRLTAQTFTTLHSFTVSDGGGPRAAILSGNTLYGTAEFSSGFSGYGTVFKVNTDGTGFTTLHRFTAAPDPYDGANPLAGVMLSGNTLYGTACNGGSYGNGTVFAVNTDGTGFTNLHSFTSLDQTYYINSDGANPYARLVLSGNTLYGTATYGGSSGRGTVFALNTNGTGFTILHSFTGGSDGALPETGVILSGNTLYGTAVTGGSGDAGTVFAVNTDGQGFTNLHSFTATPGSPPYTNSDGAFPVGRLTLSNHTLYGVAQEGGSLGVGTVFKVNTDGTDFTLLHTFTAGSGSPPSTYINSDGAYPTDELILWGNTLYGTAAGGGGYGNGTVFAVNTNGTGFTNLHSFTAVSNGTNSDGATPLAKLILSGNTLYGTARKGGSSAAGTVFSISFRPQLTITPSETNVILSWPTNVAGFDYTGYTLQSAPALTGTFTNLPAATNPYTNRISGGPHKFFRLSQ